jgi:hypothetical protein
LFAGKEIFGGFASQKRLLHSQPNRSGQAWSGHWLEFLRSMHMYPRNLARIVVASCLLFAGVFAVAANFSPSAQANERSKSPEIEGRLLAIDGTTGNISIAARSNVVTATANRNTKVERNGRRTLFANLRPGDWVEVRLAAGGNIATKIEAFGP